VPDALLFMLGAGVRCADGDCGTIKSLVINPADDAVTHLLVEPAHEQGPGRLVPVSLVEAAPHHAGDGDVRLGCTLAQFGALDPGEATEFLHGGGDYDRGADPSVSWPYYAPPGPMGGPGLPGDPELGEQVVTVDTVPDRLPGEDEVFRGEHVHATDGHIGHVEAILVDPGTGRVTEVLIREWRHLRRRTVLIPRSAVATVEADGFHLQLTAQQVRDLPPAAIA
jgi:sporulation protein YlmC with PRC-barrel domain